MTNSISDISQRKSSLIAGIGLLVMTFFVLFAIYFAFKDLIVSGNAAATAENIKANMERFRVGIFSYIVVIVCDILVAWALFVFLKPVNKNLSLLAAWFRLVYSVIFAIALVNYFNVLQLLENADYLKIFNRDQLNTNIMLLLNTFRDGWDIGFVFFGIHLTIIGFLLIKSGNLSKIIGLFVLAAGLSYLSDKIGKFLIPGYNLNIHTFVGWGELIFMFWLLFKGLKHQK